MKTTARKTLVTGLLAVAALAVPLAVLAQSAGGTDNHMLLLDLRSRKTTGAEGEKLLEEAGITCNKNMIPFDPEKPTVTSGVRLGTAAVTTRGMKEPEMELIADAIDKVLSHPDSETIKKEAKAGMARLSEDFPLYPDFAGPWAN